MKYAVLALALGFAAPITAADAKDYPVTLTYVAPATVQTGAANITLGSVLDRRKWESNWLGGIRGGYNNMLKTLRTNGPVSDEVAAALRGGLAARGMAAESGPYRLEVLVLQMDCNQYARKEAHAILGLTLIDAKTSAVLYQKETKVDRVEGSVMSMKTGIFASTEDLRKVANAALQDAVDQALDDPGFRAAIANGPAIPITVVTAPLETPPPAAPAEVAPPAETTP